MKLFLSIEFVEEELQFYPIAVRYVRMGYAFTSSTFLNELNKTIAAISIITPITNRSTEPELLLVDSFGIRANL